MNLQTYMALEAVKDCDFEKLLSIQALTDIDPPNGTVKTISLAPTLRFSESASSKVVSYKTNIDISQNGTGDPSPSNIRSFIGREEVNIYRFKKNLFDISYAFNGSSQNISGSTINKVYTSYYFDLLNGTTGETAIADKKIELGGGVYTLSGSFTGIGALRIYAVSKDGYVSSSALANINENKSSQSFTMARPGFITLRYSNRESCTVSNLQIEAGNTATTYSSDYSKEKYTIEFPSKAGVVYGGTLDVTRGKLSADKVGITLDGITNNVKSIETVGSNIVASLGEIIPSDNYNSEFFSSHFKCFKYSDRSSATVNSLFTNNENGEVCWISDSLDSVDEFNEFLIEQDYAGTPVMIVYSIKEPKIYRPSSIEIELLIGDNTIWADCGSSSLVYRIERT